MTTLKAKPIFSVFLAGTVLLGTGCASTAYRRSTGTYFDDTGTTARVKTALLRDPIVRGTAVNVDVFRGHATLSGFVASEEQKERAAQVASTIPGVEWINNTLMVKTELPGSEFEAMGQAGGQSETGSSSGAQSSSGWQSASSSADSCGQNLEQSSQSREDASSRSFNSERGRQNLEFEVDRRNLPNQSSSEMQVNNGLNQDISDQGRGTTPADLSNIRIEAANGVATVRGTVATEEERLRIGSRLLQIPGVERVNNELNVRQQE